MIEKPHNIHVKLDAIVNTFEQQKVGMQIELDGICDTIKLSGIFDTFKDLAPGVLGLSANAKQKIKALMTESIDMCLHGKDVMIEKNIFY
jgi:hypothetical protein